MEARNKERNAFLWEAAAHGATLPKLPLEWGFSR